jgi:hypothetical protein
VPTFAPSKPKKKRNLLLLSSDLSRGWQAAFTLKDLRESLEVNGDMRDTLEPMEKLLGFLANGGEEGALATAAVVLVAAADGGGASLSLSLDHGGKLYSLPPRLADSELLSSAPCARPLTTREELTGAASKLVEALDSRAAAAESRAAAAGLAVEAARRVMRDASRLVRDRVEGPIARARPSVAEVEAAGRAAALASSSARGGRCGGGGGSAAAAAAPAAQAQAVAAADRKLRLAQETARAVRVALAHAESDPSGAFGTGEHALSGGGGGGAGGAAVAGPPPPPSLPGSAAASPAATAGPSPQQQQNGQSQRRPPPPLHASVGALITEANVQVKRFQATQQQQQQQQQKQKQQQQQQSLGPSRPLLPPRTRPVSSPSGKFVPKSGAGRVKKLIKKK